MKKSSMPRLLILLLCLSLSLSGFSQVQTGKASFYSDKFEGLMTASGEKYRHNKLTGAHRTLPFGTVVRITNVANNNTVDVTINDRGPYVDGRIVDVSKSAAEKLGFVNQGLADVKLEVIDPGDGTQSSIRNPISNVTVDEKEFYDFDIDRQQPKGFGVQIGSYQELVNLLRLAENLKKSYRKKVTVQVKILNGTKFYGLILSGFSTREKVSQFREQIIKKYPDAFIVEFDRL